ncbi:MAG TPA: hypothetical protein VD905_16935, partial [Flavobacteriales bacterium]|nr:hypothetical protein [Flavobacteriales bacterium]
MNTLFTTLLVTGALAANAGKLESGLLKSVAPFREGKVETDKTLEAHQAVYKFHFNVQYQNKKTLKTVWLKVDNCEKVKPVLDSLGWCTYTMAPGKHNFEFCADKCQIVKGETNVKPYTRNEFEITFTDTTVVVVVCKPVIYLYPKEEFPVTVKLDVKGELGFTYPTYHDQWTVLAYPNGKIQDEGTMFNYLFWDGKMPAHKLKYDPAVGSVVAKAELTGFFHRNLSELGFTSWEMQDFMTYWVPKMLENDFNYVHFLVDEDYEQIAGVTVTPKPDHMLRVYMLWHPVKDKNTVTCIPQ